jgi:hypothetical protein
MKDPFFIGPIPWLSQAVQPLADRYNLPTLPLHIHEALFGLILYSVVYYPISPLLSTKLFPQHYPQLTRRTRISWDAHVVSLVQSLLINVLALWVLFADTDRTTMTREERVWGYTGGSGMLQGLFIGYFIWDLAMSLVHFTVFGPGALAHAVCALSVYTVGFRPFIHYYSPIFILWELSTPFLNFHWFFDKIKMTGSRAQLINGIALLSTFFGVRLVWGAYQSTRVARDLLQSLNTAPSVAALLSIEGETIPEVMRFVTSETTAPLWAVLAVVLSNLVLNSLNFYWFRLMIKAVTKRFVKKPDIKQEGSEPRVTGEKSEHVPNGDAGELRRRKA